MSWLVLRSDLRKEGRIRSPLLWSRFFLEEGLSVSRSVLEESSRMLSNIGIAFSRNLCLLGVWGLLV